MVVVRLFVEGGGDNKALRTECRRGFMTLLERAGLKGRMPRVVACGSRSDAYDSFRSALSREQETLPLLLVDSEEPVTTAAPWTHVKARQGDGWERPRGAEDRHLHLMVECMEAWFLADPEALERYFGSGFRAKGLAVAAPEDVSKRDLFGKLDRATRGCETKGAYRKGKHSFQILLELDPRRVRAACPWADRFFAAIEAPV